MLTRRNTALACLLAALTAFWHGVVSARAPGQSAQEPPAAGSQAPPQPTFRTGVRVVRVDVSVTGKGDRPVTDLSADDFTVEEDGAPQKVESVQFLHLDGTRGAAGGDSLAIRSQEHAEAEAARDDVRIFALFFDDYHVDKRPFITVPMRRALESFVARLGPTDLVAVMDPLTPLSALKFTRDFVEVREWVKKLEGRQGETFPIKSVMEEEQLMARNRRMIRAEVTLSALSALVTRLGGLREGRKSVVFVSQGPSTYFGFDGHLEDRMTEVLRAANRGNVNITVFDPRGLGGEGMGVRDTLYRLADETGGRRIVDTNGFEQGLEHVMADASAYYLLGYAPTRPVDDGKFHQIKVRVRRSGTHVTARKGYWAPDAGEVAKAEEAAARPVDPVLTAALSPMAESKSGRVVDIWTGVNVAREGHPVVQVTWEPAGNTPSPGRETPQTLEVERLDAEGKALGEAIPVASSTGVRGDEAVARLAAVAGALSLRLTARLPDGGAADRWTQTIDVPNIGAQPLMLATPEFRRARSPLEFRALRQQPGSAPSAGRRFRRTDRVLIGVTALGAAASAAGITADLLNREGKALASLPVPDTSGGALAFELPVASLAPGTYLLRLVAQAGDQRVERLEGFQIVP
jgi:VWFA-related protein